MLTSDDLVTWRDAGTVLPEPPEGEVYWAPEVAYDNGTFHLYYSAGGAEGEGHQVRTATAEDPLGPFTPVGGPLDPDESFSIDASPFRDVDGTWYLYSCRDFLDGPRVGTGIVVHRLAGMRTLDGPPEVVVRPHAEWHVYERQRQWYGRTWDWYTVEGPFVIRHGGRYWCFFSGGAWRADNYGVTWAVADHPLGPWVPAPGGATADVLRTAPGAIGPGHASVVLGPDLRTHHLVYHAWDEELRGRHLCIDELRWSSAGTPVASGPTVGPTPAPTVPGGRFLEERVLDEPLLMGEMEDDSVIEVNLAGRGAASFGLSVGGLDVVIQPDRGAVRVGDVEIPLPAGFRAARYHQLAVRAAVVELDGRPLAAAPVAPGPVELTVAGGAAAFAGVTVS